MRTEITVTGVSATLIAMKSTRRPSSGVGFAFGSAVTYNFNSN